MLAKYHVKAITDINLHIGKYN